MIKCLMLACMLPLIFTLCSPRQDPNLNRDKRGEAIKLVQNSSGRDGTHKTVDFATQDVNILRLSGEKVAEYGWSAESDSSSANDYYVKFAYKGKDGVKEAIWKVNVVTKEVKATNTQAHKYSG